MVEISITLDRSDHKYNPGDVINLVANVRVTTEAKIRSIYARFQGYAHVEWTESHQVKDREGKSHTEYTTYSSHESFFKHYQTLVGTRSGSEMQLSVGSHVYRASFVLPNKLPENHENTYGHIRYEAKVHADVPWGFDEVDRIGFHVRPRFDLNEFRHLCEPVRAETNKTFGCCCWESEPLHTFNVLPRSGYVPGDRAQYSLELNNNSDVKIDYATVKLVENIVYHAYSPRSRTQDYSRTLWRHEFHERNSRQLVAALQNKVFSTDLFFDPSWNFNYFHGCGIITVSYQLISKAYTSGCHTNLSNYTGITIGTIPFGNFGTILPPTAPMMPFPSAPLAGYPSAPPAEPISEQPLPSYDETQSKLMAPGIGWAGADSLETRKKFCCSEILNHAHCFLFLAPPTFTEIVYTDKKEKQ